MPADILRSIYELLSNNWNSTNTDKRTPLIQYNEKDFDTKRVDMNNRTSILLYEMAGADLAPNALGKTSQKEEYFVSVDMRTDISRSHAKNCANEVRRIMNGHIVQPDSDFQQADIFRQTDLSNRNARIWHFVLDYDIKNHEVVRNT